MNGDGQMPPQVIRHADGSFQILNVNLESMSAVQRLALGVLVWDQFRALFKQSGEYKEKEGFWEDGVGTTDMIDRTAAETARCAWSSLNQVRPRLVDRPDVTEAVLAGDIKSVADIKRTLGMRVRMRLSEGAPSHARPGSIYYGKGDRFGDAIEPLSRYLKGWEKKDFSFTHVPPGEAGRRLQTINQVITSLEKVKEDLVKRSHVATLTVPSGNRKGRK